MAAKTLFAIAAALCAFATATAIPVFQLEEDSDLLRNELVSNWNSASEVLEQIQQVLDSVKEKIKEVSENTQNAAQGVVDGIDAEIAEFADKWTAAAQVLVDEAAKGGVDIQDCLNQQQSLSDVIAAIRSEAQLCAGKSLDALAASLKDLEKVEALAQELIDETKVKVDECEKEDNGFSSGICLAFGLYKVQIKAVKVVTQATQLFSAATAKAAAVAPTTVRCTYEAIGRHADEATAISNETVSCISSKLDA